MTGTARKVGQAARDRAVEHHMSRLMMIVPPWIGALLLLPLAAIFHRAWPVWWAALILGVIAAGLGVLTVLVAHEKSKVHRWHLALTVALVTVFLLSAELAGFRSRVWFVYMCGPLASALSWNITGAARHTAMGNMLGHLLGAAHEQAGLEGVRVTVTPAKSPTARVIKGRVAGVPGKHTGKTIADAAALVESAAGLPPGSATYSASADDRGVAEFSIADPRSTDRPVPWPGASKVGDSIGEPLRVGTWQTGEDILLSLIPAHHILLTGMTGSAKSTGAAWTLLAEIITRSDVEVFAVDVTKGDQTLGMFRPCFATAAPGCETGILTEPEQVDGFLAWTRAQIRPRTDHLARQHRQGWTKDCGLKLMVVWLEEAPDVVDAASAEQVEAWVSSMKAARSAGIIFVYSCQRPDWSQLPTIARAQFAGRITMGVNLAADADMCMTERQDKAGCEPDQWADRKPGAAYFDGPWVTDAQVPMHGRFYFWGPDGTLIAAHAANYTRNHDGAAMTPPVVNPPPWPPGREDDTPAQVARQVLGPDDDPVDTPDLTEPIPDWQFGDEPAAQVSVDEPTARQQLDGWLAERLAAGESRFRAIDLVEFLAEVDMSRGWMYDELTRRTARGQLRRDKDDHSWTVVQAA